MLKSIQTAIMQIETHEWAVLYIFCVIYIFRIFYHFAFIGKVFFKKLKIAAGGMPLSLILTVRNEEKNISNYLPPVLEAKDAKFELIAVDDYSGDNSAILLGSLKEKYRHLKISSLNQEILNSVKMAQNIAIKASEYDWIMVIPPSVSKFNPEWLQAVTSSLNHYSDIIVNYSNLEHTGSLFNILFRVEYFLQQIKSAGYIANGLSFIITEENVAFRKEKYYASGGYRHKISEPYANLELLINTFINKKSTKINFDKKTTIFKNENIGASDFFDLLKKEIRIRKHLSFSKKAILTIEEFTECIFLPLMATIYFIIPPLLPLLALLYILMISTKLFIIKKALKRLNESKLLLSSLICALFLPCLKLGYRFYYTHFTLNKKCKSKR